MGWYAMAADVRVSDLVFFFQAEDGIRDYKVTGVQTCALPISHTPTTIWSPRLRHSSPIYGSGVALLHCSRAGRPDGDILIPNHQVRGPASVGASAGTSSRTSSPGGRSCAS